MERVLLEPLSRVAVCGGTHGDELCGVYLLRELQRRWPPRRDGSGSGSGSSDFSLTTVLGNPRAVDACRRYTERDLNRCFADDLLSAPISEDTPYEVRRAQELNAQLGPRGSEDAVDLLCDLHNTTANMGVCVIAHQSDWVSLHLFKYLQEKMPSATVRLIIMRNVSSKLLNSVGKHGLALEVGPQPHGLLRADAFNWMREAVDRVLEWTQNFNSGVVFDGGEVDAYVVVDTIDFPRDPETQEVTAAIHPQLQDKDFSLLKPGDPAFMSFSGETVCYEGAELYAFFVNEAAYYEKHTAMVLGHKERVLLPSIGVKKKEH